MLKKVISNILKEALMDYLKDTDVKEIDSYIEIGYAADDRFGDYACPVAMRLAKILKKNPMEIADSIVSKIDKKIFESRGTVTSKKWECNFIKVFYFIYKA